jgi:hypothetical protein
MKVLCYSVRLSSLTSISEKAYKAVAFDGSEAITPKSQVLGQDSELTKSGMGDDWIMKQIGMDADELLRLKQLSGLAELFQNKNFSESWEK